METLYILEPGTYLRRESEALKVVRGDQVIDKIPAAGLKKLILGGYASLSGAVLDFLISRRIETVFITPTGRYRGRMMVDPFRHVELRKAQYLQLSDETFALNVARCIVRGKVENMSRMLVSRAALYDDAGMRHAAVQLHGVRGYLQYAEDLDKLRGLEGAATRLYFAAFKHMVRNDAFEFKGRNRRPPRDPVNALLSFAYTMLTNEVQSAINICGLDPGMGALHAIAYGRPSLACDLVEEYRSFLADRMVLSLINRKMVTPDDFVYRSQDQVAYTDEQEMKAARPVEMKPAVRRAFVASYEQMMTRRVNVRVGDERSHSYRNLLLSQARRFQNMLLQKSDQYQPFIGIY